MNVYSDFMNESKGGRDMYIFLFFNGMGGDGKSISFCMGVGLLIDCNLDGGGTYIWIREGMG
jgi:hypothetical protein